MSLKKRYFKTKPVSRVTFRLSRKAARNAERVFLVGDFNGWDARSTPMKRLKNGDFTVSVDLPVGREYHFRYLIDDTAWENDWEADKYCPSPYPGAENSVVVV